MKTCTRTFGYDAWNAPMSGASNESEMLGGAESRSSPETFDRWFDAILSTASLSSMVWRACSRSSDPTSVSRRLRVERSSKRTPSSSARSATRRLTVEVGIFKSRAASEKLFASTTLAKIMREFRSVIRRCAPPIVPNAELAADSPHIVRPLECAVPQRLSQIRKIHLLFRPLDERTWLH